MNILKYGWLKHTWFASHLSEQQQHVCFNGGQSDFLPNSHGVPPRIELEPTFFLTYINDLLAQLPEGAAVAYANDVTLLASRDTATLTALQGLLDVVCRWSTINSLYINPSKCMTMFSRLEIKICYSHACDKHNWLVNQSSSVH